MPYILSYQIILIIGVGCSVVILSYLFPVEGKAKKKSKMRKT